MNAETALRTPNPAEPPSRTILRWAGRLVLLAWAGFWTWFNVASLVGEVEQLGVGAWLNHGLLAAVIVVATLLALLRPRIGGVVLLVLAAGLAIVFHAARPQVLGIFAAPPALAGLLALLTTPRADREGRGREA